MKKIFTKYLILITIYLISSHLLFSLGFKIYYNIVENPEDISSNAFNMFDMIISSISALLKIVIAIFLIVDLKRKRLLEWLIVIIAILYPSIGVGFFLLHRFVFNDQPERQINEPA